MRKQKKLLPILISICNMKKIVYIIIFLIAFTGNSQSENSIFKEANTFYKENNFERAIGLYLSIEEQGLESSELFFNLGNSYYKQNKVAPAIYYFEKALKLNPKNKDAIINIVFAKRMKIDVIEELPKTFIQKLSKNIIQKLAFDSWAILAVITSFFASILFLLYHFSSTTRKKLVYFNFSIFFAFVLIITTIFAFKSYDIDKKDRPAIIFSTKVEIKNAPTLTSDEVFELHEGTKVQILDELDNWKKIKIADGKEGWIIATHLKEI